MAENDEQETSPGDGDGGRRSDLPRRLARGAAKGALAGAAAGAVSATTTGVVVGASGAALIGAGKELVGWAIDQVRTPTDQLIENDQILSAAREVEKVRALEAAQAELEARVQALRTKLGEDEPLASSLHAAMAAWSRAWNSTHSSKKQRLITAVLVSTFDPECYDVGLSLRLMRLLEDLDYPELELLRTIGKAPRDHPVTWGDATEGSLKRDLIRRLHDAGLVWWPDAWNERLSAGNIRTPRTSELGDHLLRLVESGWLHAAARPSEGGN